LLPVAKVANLGIVGHVIPGKRGAEYGCDAHIRIGNRFGQFMTAH